MEHLRPQRQHLQNYNSEIQKITCPMFPISTSRLHIRHFTEADADAVANLQDDCFGKSPRVAREEWLQWCIRNYRALAELNQPPYGDYAIAVNDGDVLVGSIGLVPSFGPFEKLPWFQARLRSRSSGLFTPEMGLFWAMHSQHRGLGYATEAAGAIAKFAFEVLRVDRLVATTQHANTPSIRVMRKLGMTIETNPDLEPKWFQTVGVLQNVISDSNHRV
jgi:RimJ/RimL family protein N-acetyltransferase